MGLVIDNEALVAMIRDLADRRRVTPDEALREAVEREVARDAGAAKADRLIAIAREGLAMKRLADWTEDEILGYDEDGIPTR